MVATNNILNADKTVLDPTVQPHSVNNYVNGTTQHIIDLRSDTVTRPTDEMRQAMANAEVGDDVFGDDPTVNELQSYAASILGKEAALFVPSGTMANLIACMVHCPYRDSEMIVGDKAHIFFYEAGGSAQYGGIHTRTVANKLDGTIELSDIEQSIRPVDQHFPTTRLVCLEQTHNLRGGVVLSTEYVNQVATLAHKYNLKLHIDGARFFNAVTYLNEDPRTMLQNVDSISICLSKGLAAPVGSLLVGTKEFIASARRVRKGLGGGMRQAGILAAAGLVSLKQMTKRLYIDHNNASLLAKSLNNIDGLSVDLNTAQTNIVYVDVNTQKLNMTTSQLIDTLAKQYNVRGMVTNINRVRFVINYHITEQDIQYTIDAIQRIVQSSQKQ